MAEAQTRSKAAATKKPAAKKASPKKRSEPRTLTTSTPIYMRTLIDVATGWYAEPGDATEEQLDVMVDDLVLLGGNE